MMIKRLLEVGLVFAIAGVFSVEAGSYYKHQDMAVLTVKDWGQDLASKPTHRPVYSGDDETDGGCNCLADCDDADAKSCLNACNYEEPADVPAWATSLNYKTSYQKDRFEVVGGFAGVDSEVTTKKEELTFEAVGDRAVIGVSVFYAQSEWTQSANVDYESYGVSLFPAYKLLDQAVDGVDLYILGGLGLSKIEYEYDALQDDPYYLHLGAGLSVGKTTGAGDFRLTYVASSMVNIDGDDEVTEESTISSHTVSGRYSIPITERVSLSTGLAYTRISELPDTYQANEVLASAGLIYRGDHWSAGLDVERSLGHEENRAWGLSASVGYHW